MMVLGWYIALIIWLLGMWLAWRVNQAIIDMEFREMMRGDATYSFLVYLYCFFIVLLWPVVQLFAIQRAFVHGDNHENKKE